MARSILTPLTITTGGNTITSSSAASVPLVLKGAASQSGSLLSFQNDSGTVIGNFTAPVNNVPRLNLGSTDLGATVGINGHATGGVTLAIKAIASQTADMQQWINSGNSVLAKVDQNGFAVFGGATVLSNSVLSISPYGTTQVGATIRAVSGQTANLQNWQSSAGTTLSGVSPNGQVFVGSTTPYAYAVGGATTAASGDGTTATITTTSAHNLAVGDRITVSGITPSGYNGTYIVTAVTTNNISYLNATTGSQTVAGAVNVDAQFSVTARSGATVPIIIRGGGFNVDLQRWYTSSNALAAIINPYGSLVGYASANGFFSDNGNNYILRTVGATDQRGNAFLVQNVSGTNLAGFNAQGQIFTGSTTPIQGSTTVAINTQTPTGTTNITITTAAAHGILVGQTVVIAGITPSGYNGTWTAQSGTTGSTLVVNIGSNPGAITVAGTVTQNSQVGITASSANNTPLAIRAAASQAANITEWFNSSGTSLGYVTAGGTIQMANVVSNAAMRANGSLASSSTAAVNIVSNATIGHLVLQNISTTPNTPTGGGVMYVDSGALKYLGTSGSAQTIVSANGTVNFTGAVTATGDISTSTILKSNQSSGDEGGQIDLAKSVTNTTLTTGISIDVFQNRLRFFETGGTNRGYYIDISTGGSGAGTNLVGGGGSFTGGTLTSDLVLAAGSGTVEPLTFQTNSATPTVTSGAMDYDGVVFYQASNTNPGRALNTQNYYYVSSADYGPDFTASGSVQSMLGAATRGITVAAGTTYEYELYATVQHQYILNAGITGTYQLVSTTVSGSPTVSVVHQIDYGSNTTNFTTATTLSTVRTTGSVVFSAAISSGSRYNFLRAKGVIRVTGTGTTKLYPGLSTSQVGASDNIWTIQNGLVFKLTPVGNGTVTSVGTWA